jgi:HlyD family secretion protein
MKIKIKPLLPLLGVLGLVVTIIYISSGDAPPPKQEPVAQPSIVPYERYIGGSGITEPNTEIISIGTNKGGIVKSVEVEIGQEVKTDDVLFVIENSESEAAMRQSEARLKNAQQQYNTIAGIEDKRAISKDERQGRANALAEAEAAFEGASATFELHNVHAPIDGIVLTSNVRVGEYAPTGASAKPLMRLGNISPMNIRVDIDENDAWRFKPSARATAYVRGNNEIKTELQFIRIEPYVRPKTSLTGDSMERVDTRVLQVIYNFDPTNIPIYAGQQMDVYIEEIKE